MHTPLCCSFEVVPRADCLCLRHQKRLLLSSVSACCTAVVQTRLLRILLSLVCHWATYWHWATWKALSAPWNVLRRWKTSSWSRVLLVHSVDASIWQMTSFLSRVATCDVLSQLQAALTGSSCWVWQNQRLINRVCGPASLHSRLNCLLWLHGGGWLTSWHVVLLLLRLTKLTVSFHSL